MKPKKSLLLMLSLLPVALCAKAQNDPVYISGQVYVGGAGDNVQWYGNAELAPAAQLYLQDVQPVTFYGQNFKMNPGAQVYGANVGWTIFTQGAGTGNIAFTQPNPMNSVTAQQTLDAGNGGNPANSSQNTFTSIVLNNSAGVKLINTDSRVGTDISFASGHLYTDAHDLVLSSTATISNSDATKYIVTNMGNAAGGHLVKESFTSAFSFPIGMADNDYTPVVLTPAVSNTLHVNVTDYNTSTPVESVSDGMDRTWNIWGNGSNGALITLQHNTITNQSSFIGAASFVTQYGSALNNTGDLPSQSHWQSNTPGTSVVGTIVGSEIGTRFYLALATNGVANEAFFSKSSNILDPLPLVLQNFTANAEGCNALVSWKTGTESLMDYFAVEESADGVDFTNVAKVMANNKDGSDYSVTVAQHEATAMYRLSMMEKNGRQSYSQVAVVRTACNGSGQPITSTPNPTRGNITINGLGAGQRVLVLDVLNRQLGIYSTASATLNVDLSDYVAGTYTISVVDASNHLIQTMKIVKVD